MKQVAFIVFSFLSMSGIYDHDIWNDFTVIHQYYTSADENDLASIRKAHMLYFLWREYRTSEKGRELFARKYVKVHNRDLYFKFHTSKVNPPSQEEIEQYESLEEKGGLFFDIIETFMKMPSRQEDEAAWFTSVLETLGISGLKTKEKSNTKGDSNEKDSRACDFTDNISLRLNER